MGDGLVLLCGVVLALGPVGTPLKWLVSPCNALEDSRPSLTGLPSPNLKSVGALLVKELTAGRVACACTSSFCQGSDAYTRGSRGKPACKLGTRSALGPVGGWKGAWAALATGSALGAVDDDGMSAGGSGGAATGTAVTAGAAVTVGLRLSRGTPNAGTCGAEGGELALEGLAS